MGEGDGKNNLTKPNYTSKLFLITQITPSGANTFLSGMQVKREEKQ